MHPRPARIFPLSENAVTVEFGHTISEEINLAAISLAEYFADNPFPGFIEAVPAIASTTIFYRPAMVRSSNDASAAFEVVKGLINDAMNALPRRFLATRSIVEVPVIFSAEYSLDLEPVSSLTGISAEEVIEIFLSSVYRVYMLGFLPGFAYMGNVDERIAVPRHATPRSAVPKGSVGIAGRQTGIYPSESPGGWQIIGRTPLELLRTGGSSSPCIFAPGDRVRFVLA